MPQGDKPGPGSYGVLLDSVIAALPKEARPQRQDDSLIVQHPNFVTRLDVVQPPPGYESKTGPIKAVVQIRSEFPSEVVSTVFKKPEDTSGLNSYATVGALTAEDGKVFVGSRVTLYEDDEQAWSIYLPLIVFALTGGTTSLMGAMQRAFANKKSKRGKSAWTDGDFGFASKQLLQFCVCTTGGPGLTAEFGLREGAISAAQHDCTALLQLRTDQPHPEMGGGLFCLLQMPHEHKDEEALDRTVVQLNKMEMEPHELAPHFGAWCRGQLEHHNPAYVSFLPNGLHSKGIALNVALWAMARARLATSMLASLGVPLPQT